MSSQWMQSDDDFDDDESSSVQQAPRGLRKQLDKVAKENKELREANDRLLKQVRQTAISQVLSTKGIDAKVAKLVPSDIEPTEDAVGAWLSDYADFFSAKTPPAGEAPKETAGDESSQEGEGGDDNAELAATMSRMSAVADQSQAPGKQADLLKQLGSKSLTQEQLLELIASHGGGVGSG